MIGNKPSFNEFIKFDYDYIEETSFNGAYVAAYTAKIGGVYDTAAGTLSGGTVVGYIYIKYTGATRANWTNVYTRKA